MKCPSCSAENAPGATFCEYCGTAVGREPTKNEIFDKNTGAATAQTAQASSGANIFPNMSDPAYQVWTNKCNIPTNDLNWLAFIFPVGYLAGYGAISSALAVIFSTAALFLSTGFLVGLSHGRLSALALVALVVSIVYTYRIAKRVDGILGKNRDKAKFNWGAAIGLTILYSIIFNGAF